MPTSPSETRSGPCPGDAGLAAHDPGAVGRLRPPGEAVVHLGVKQPCSGCRTLGMDLGLLLLPWPWLPGGRPVPGTSDPETTVLHLRCPALARVRPGAAPPG